MVCDVRRERCHVVHGPAGSAKRCTQNAPRPFIDVTKGCRGCVFAAECLSEAPPSQRCCLVCTFFCVCACRLVLPLTILYCTVLCCTILCCIYAMCPLPSQVLTSGFLTKHPKLVGIHGMVSAAVEWLLFSACNAYVTVESGLSKTAYAYNLHAPPLFMFDRLDMPMHVHRECNLLEPLSILDLGNWSGL